MALKLASTTSYCALSIFESTPLQSPATHKNSISARNCFSSFAVTPVCNINYSISFNPAPGRIASASNRNPKFLTSRCSNHGVHRMRSLGDENNASLDNEGSDAPPFQQDHQATNITMTSNSSSSLVPVKGAVVSESSSLTYLEKLDQRTSMGLVVQAALGTGWTTGSGLEGPSFGHGQFSSSDLTPKTPFLSKSPRRRMVVKFTCNKCGERTTRAINPHAYKEGTVFVQCGGCEVFHKLVDNLRLFHEMKGPIYHGYENGDFGFAHEPFDPIGRASNDGFPL